MLDQLIMWAAGVGAIICLVIGIAIKIKPREYENCVLKPRGFEAQQPRRRGGNGNQKRN